MQRIRRAQSRNGDRDPSHRRTSNDSHRIWTALSNFLLPRTTTSLFVRLQISFRKRQEQGLRTRRRCIASLDRREGGSDRSLATRYGVDSTTHKATTERHSFRVLRNSRGQVVSHYSTLHDDRGCCIRRRRFDSRSEILSVRVSSLFPSLIRTMTEKRSADSRLRSEAP